MFFLRKKKRKIQPMSTPIFNTTLCPSFNPYNFQKALSNEPSFGVSLRAAPCFPS